MNRYSLSDSEIAGPFMDHDTDGEYVRYEDVARLVQELFDADAAYGCGFYSNDRWLAAYDALRVFATSGGEG